MHPVQRQLDQGTTFFGLHWPFSCLTAATQCTEGKCGPNTASLLHKSIANCSNLGCHVWPHHTWTRAAQLSIAQTSHNQILLYSWCSVISSHAAFRLWKDIEYIGNLNILLTLFCITSSTYMNTLTHIHSFNLMWLFLQIVLHTWWEAPRN